MTLRVIKGTPEQLIRAIEHRIEQLDSDVEASEDIMSAEQFSDAEYTYDEVQATESMDEVVDIDEDAEPIEGGEAEDLEYDDDLEFDIYLTDLIDEVGNELEQGYGISADWTNDDENLYATVVQEDSIHDFTIPYADLTKDSKKDVEYIVNNIKESI